MTRKNLYCVLASLLLWPVLCVLTLVDAPDLAAQATSRAPSAEAPATEVSEGGAGAVYLPTESAGESYQVCNCTTLNVRSQPGVDGIVIAWLKPIQRVRVMETAGDWARLSSGGWVHKGYLCP